MHNSGEQRRIDPSKSNIIDVYILTSTYDNEYRNYVSQNLSDEPLPPTSSSLEQNYGSYLGEIKAVSDEVIFHPVKYKKLFGSRANIQLQATFKAVRNNNLVTNDNNLKNKILSLINDFFNIQNWNFGQSFYFSELATFVMNQLTPEITNFIIVPKLESPFGSLLEIGCLPDELLISVATIDNIEVIDAITNVQLQTSANIITA